MDAVDTWSDIFFSLFFLPNNLTSVGFGVSSLSFFVLLISQTSLGKANTNDVF